MAETTRQEAVSVHTHEIGVGPGDFVGVDLVVVHGVVSTPAPPDGHAAVGAVADVIVHDGCFSNVAAEDPSTALVLRTRVSDAVVFDQEGPILYE